jgi:hypothetical protein
MIQILKLRIILDTEADVFRDIEIAMNAPLEHLHLATLDAFNWDNATEMSSYYKSNENWDKGDEIPLMSMSPELPCMESTSVGDLFPNLNARGVYVYDYLRMWCFFIEPMTLEDAEENVNYPRLMMEFGTPPRPDSRQPEGLDDLGQMAQEIEQSKKADSIDSESYSTGDPELDAYLSGDSGEDDYSSGKMDNIDDFGEIL